MKVSKDNREILRWDFKDCGLFEATIWNGKITRLDFCRKSDSNGEKLWALEGSEKFLQAVHRALGELLDHLEAK